jgi:dihydroneopterin aldolase
MAMATRRHDAAVVGDGAANIRLTALEASEGRVRAHDLLHVCYTTIAVRNFEVAADIGILPHEIGSPQTLSIDVVLEVTPPEQDKIGCATDYVDIVTTASQLGRRRTALIETFAQELALALIDDEKVRSADVLVRKPNALPSGVAEARVLLRATSTEACGLRSSSHPLR